MTGETLSGPTAAWGAVGLAFGFTGIGTSSLSAIALGSWILLTVALDYIDRSGGNRQIASG